ncbi:hypothetical protein [Breoghania sp.]|uniref:hypothetical protein n=1 Tax=Breoghania sp. TaxID=2065378 RepID=UPI002AA74980|nr:hypothetical protein [Breoghania sp.]
MSDRPARSALDTPYARILALLIACLTAALLGWINRDALFASAPAPSISAKANPELDACLSERVGAVERMRKEGVVNERQYDEFRTRAEDYCTARFPPAQ